jgi:putative ABC transport system substrate-binding protein
MQRRGFALLLGSVAIWPRALLAQSPKKLPRVGFLGNATPALEAELVEAFRQGLRDFGFKEGEDIQIEYRWAEGRYELFPSLIAELIAAKVDVIVTAGTPASLAVQQATKTIPVVMIAIGDPIGTGLVASLGRPGGNLTGLTSIAPELEGKRLELLREVMPTASHVAVLWNPVNPFQLTSIKQLTEAAREMRFKVLSLGARSLKEIEAAFATILEERPHALFVLADRVFLHNRARIMEFATRERLPGVHAYRELVHAGGLMSYGPSYEDMHRRAGEYVNVILRGADPANLPVQRPMKFNLVVNLKAAKALGLTIPESILFRADEVIE